MDKEALEEFVEKHGSKEFKQNFIGVFAVDKLKHIVENLDTRVLPSCIFNTDESSQPGMHWCVIHSLNEDQPAFFVFDPFGKLGYQTFFMNSDQTTLKSLIKNYHLGTIDERNVENNLDVFSWNIDCGRFTELSREELEKLSDTCRGVFMLFCSYLKYKNRREDKKNKTIKMYGIVDRLQNKNRTTCGAHCLYYLHNLYEPHESFGVGTERGDIGLVRKLLNSIYVEVKEHDLDTEEANINNTIINEFIDTFDVKILTRDRELLRATKKEE